MHLEEVLEAVENEELKKSDSVTKMQFMVPMVENNRLILKMGRNNLKRFTPTGMSSYLQKIDVPIGFLNKCSSDLKREVVSEFHSKFAESEVMVRMYDNDIIRYVASSKYAKFDDVNIMRTLHSKGLDLQIKEFVQTSDFFILRAVGDEFMVGDKKYFSGIQLMNSEVGRSALKVQFLLWEEVCTNGLIVQNREISGFSMIHSGKDREEKLQRILNTQIENYQKFDAKIKKRTQFLLDNVSAEDTLNKLKSVPEVPKWLLEKVENTVPSLESANSLDVVSAFTEGIQSYDWDQRNSFERTAGDVLWRLTAETSL